MHIRQIEARQALELAGKGEEILVMAPRGAGTEVWTDYAPAMLGTVLEGCLFFRQEPGLGEPAPAEEASGMPDTAPKRKADKTIELDAGKLKALRKAGWSHRKIADEMGVSEGTVCNRLKQMEEREDPAVIKAGRIEAMK